MEQTEQTNVRSAFLSEGRLLLAVFLAGVGLVLWLVNSVLGPLQRLESDVSNLRDNHVHTIEENVKGITENVNLLQLGQARIETILSERLPPKQQ